MRPRFASAIGLVLMFGVALWSTQAFSVANVATTKHNLSISGPGGVKSTTETEVCVFCHVPHNASNAAPLWNRASPTGTYTAYSSSTAKGNMGQPNGTSLLCLSCHDGTIAPGDMLSRKIPVANMSGVTATGMLPTTSSSYLGKDLSDDHPISFAYSAALPNPELVSAATLTGKVKLDASGQMQCSSCHDPHDNTVPKFLVMSNTASALCITCHSKTNWSTSSHGTSTATKPAAAASNPWPHTSETTVATNACENCHRPHTAGGKERLLNGSTDDVNCLTCHKASSVAKTDIATVITKSGHNVTTLGYSAAHDPSGVNEATTRHVVCSDCHNPHQATNLPVGTTTASTGMPILPGTLKAVKGVDKNGMAVANVTYEYEVCFRCHATSGSTPAITRATKESNISKKFQPPVGGSYHPVVLANSAAKSTSLITTVVGVGSTITCSACHNNSAGTNNAGTGPKGPHGSANPYLLERPVTSSAATTTSICGKCHLYGTVNADAAATFAKHNTHIGKGYPCSDCHDPHGVSNNLHLINFNTAVATAIAPNTVPLYSSTATNKGNCTLACHGKNHNALGY
jgi:predicted CXXCH cytochrome family protein